MENFGKTTIEDVLRIAKKLQWDSPFYGFFLTTIDKEVLSKDDPKFKLVPTACIGKTPSGTNFKMYINEEFWNSLEDQAKLELLMHETEHITYFHPTLALSFRDKTLFNIAADLMINQNKPTLRNDSLPLNEYYDFIKKYQKEIQSGEAVVPLRGCSFKDYGFTDADAGYGTKYYYDKLMEKMNDQKDQSKEAQNLRELVRMINDNQSTGQNHEKWKEFEKMNDFEKELIQEQVSGVLKDIMENNPKMAGSVPAHLKQQIDDLFIDKPPVFNWKAALRKFSAASTKYYTKSSRRKLNKRNPEFSSIKVKPKLKIFVGLDTSGSMSDDDIRLCFTEIDHMYRSGVYIDVGECDAALNRNEDVYQYEGKYPKNRKGISGRGGTSVQPLIEYVNDHLHEYSCFIYLTDGYMSNPKDKCKKPMLTILVPNGTNEEQLQETTYFGKVIKMNHDC